MFGCLAVYVKDQVVLILRDHRDHPADNGVWLATFPEHHASLRREFPQMRSIQRFGTPVTSWQVLPADASDFEIVGGAVVYSGPDEWSLRRMVLHYAHLAVAAGGVSAFVIGTELRGLTQVRSGASDYPFVAALVTLAEDVKSILGDETRVTYAADWSEYFGHQPGVGYPCRAIRDGAHVVVSAGFAAKLAALRFRA